MALRTSGRICSPRALRRRKGGFNLREYRTPWGKPRFEDRGDAIIQHSMVEENIEWEIVQTADTITPGNRHYNVRSEVAKTVRMTDDGKLEVGHTASRPAPRT